MFTSRFFLASIWLAMVFFGVALDTATGLAQPKESEENSSAKKVKRVLLLGQKPDGHPWSTHEYMAGVNIMAACLHKVPNLQTVVIQADDPWTEGPELIDGADGVVLFLSEGAKWVGSDRNRLAAFERLAERKGGLVCLHWGMGSRDAQYVSDFVALFGGCHGGPDRKYQVVTKTLELAAPDHPILKGMRPIEVHEEFYYRLKFPKSEPLVTPLINVTIDEESHTVAWAWKRPDGGRSCGFSGGHFHENWNKPEYRRLLAQSLLWSLDVGIPEEGLNVDLEDKILRLAPRDGDSPGLR
jgi:hypothetical protein